MKLNDHLLGDGVPASTQKTFMHGLELVPFEEGEPIPLNWSQALVEDGSRRTS